MDTDNNEDMEIIDSMTQWYEKNAFMEELTDEIKKNKDDYDEGEIYFITIDKIKEKLKNQYTDIQEELINTASEEIYNKIEKNINELN